MVDSVPQSAKPKELAALLSWEAKSLVGAGVGTSAVSVLVVRPGNGNSYEAQKIQHDRTARSRLRSVSEGLTLELQKTFGYLKSMSQFEEWSLGRVRDR